MPFYLASLKQGQGGLSFIFKKLGVKSGWQEFSMTAKMALGMGGMAELSANNVHVHNREACLDYVKKAADMLNKQDEPEDMIERNGWLEDEGFVVGDRIYVNGKARRASISQYMRERAKEMTPKGDYPTWRSATNLMLGEGSKPQAFAVLCGFAAPLMKFVGAPDEGGAIVSLYSQGTGTGKTTAIQCASSIWGGWHAMNLTNDDSHNSHMTKLGTFNNLHCTFDDIENLDAEVLRKLVDTYSKGKERERQTTTGQLQRTPYTWNNLLLTTSNRSLVEIVTHVANGPAMGQRIIELPCHDKLKEPPQGKDYYKQIFGNHYGHAGHVFASFITRPEVFRKILELLMEERAILKGRFHFLDDYRFYERVLTVATVAAKLLKHLQLLNTDFVPCINWATSMLVERRDQERGKTPKTNAVQALSQYISDCVKDFLIVQHAVHTRDEKVYVTQHPKNQLAGRVEEREQVLYVSQNHMRHWAVKSRVNLRDTLTQLRNEGTMQKAKVVNLTEGTPYPVARLDCFVFNLGALQLLPPQSPSPEPSSPP